ncbi:hypothetical protein J2S43_000304 [Catenuloplanes nepalensis]|uniref:Uncharacterized protein n=1 Tax=Catenuloplanes nepalensis TaxID=587533 RepID=A0ABT9MK48_9ACTN|nr:hypothetical protein [Catenuloplanes nepalensis]MDP9791792.1 hypothetical protein [Catenuloplanes nepalensis]
MSGEKMDPTAFPRQERSRLDALLAAASAPAATDREMPGEAAALAAFRAALAAPPPARRRSALRDVITRVLTAKIATFGLVAAAGVGSVALATVAAPSPDESASRPAPAPAWTQTMRPLPSATPSGTPAAAPAVPVAPLAAPESSPSAGRRTPDRSTPGPGQLCRELGGMDDRQRDRALRDSRYHDLVRDAGGSDRVGRFCDDRRRDRWQPSTDPTDSRDSEWNGYPGGEPSTPPSVSPAPKPPPRG